jgi:hypothetical protein
LPSSVYSRALQKAAELMGSYDKLSRYLLVPSSDLQRWIDGKAVPPTAIFLRVVDYILDETQPPSGESEPGDAPAPHDAAASGEPSATRY